MTRIDARKESTNSAEANRALVDIGRVLSLEPQLSVAFERIVGIVTSVVSADRVVVTSFDREGRLLVDEHISGIDIPGQTSEDIRVIAGTISGYVQEHPEPLVHNASNTDEILLRIPDMKVVIDAGLRSGVSCVLRSQERHVGILHVRSFEPEAYREAEIAFIEAVADLISGSLASEQLRRELESKIEEETLLAAIGQTITSSLEITDIYPLFAEQVAKLIQFDRLVISLVDEARDELVDEYIAGIEIEGMEVRSRHQLTSSDNYVAMQTGRPILVGEAALQERVEEHEPTRLALAEGLKSLMIAPLIWRDEPIGTLNFRSTIREVYAQREIRLAEAVAAQISGAVENARLYGQAEKAARVRSGVADIGRAITSSVSYDDAFNKFVEAARKLLPFDRVVISLPSTRGGTFVNAFVDGTPVPGHEAGTRIPIKNSIFDKETPPHDAVVKTAEELDPAIVAGSPEQPFVEAGLKSRLLVPLVWSEEMIGTLSLRSKLPASYGDEELDIALEIAAQISGVIATSRLHDETAKTGAMREGLAAIGRIVSSSISVEDVYGQFAEEARKIIEFDRVVVMLRSPGTDDIEITYAYGTPMEGATVGVRKPIADLSRPSVFVDGETIVTAEEQTRSESEDFGIQSTALRAGLLSRLTTPLEWRGSIIGCLDFRSKKPFAFDDAEIQTARAIAAQISGSIYSSRLYEEQEQETRIQEALASITSAASSGLEQNDVFNRVADELKLLIPYDRFSIKLIEEHDPSILTTAYVRGLEVDLLRVGDHPVNHEGPGVPWKWRTTAVTAPTIQPLEAEDASTDSQVELTSWIEAPLGTSDSDLLGYLSIRCTDTYRYTQQNLETLMRVATHISSSIKNIRLHVALGQEANERELLAEVGRVTGDSASVSEMFRHLKQIIPQLVPADSIGVTLIEKGTEQIRIIETERSKEVESLGSGRLLPLRPGLGAEAFDSKNTVLFNPEDPATVVARTPNLLPLYESGSRSFMVTPMISRREVIGTLFFQSHSEFAFNEAHVNLAERIARQIAGTLETADLHEQIQREARENELLAEIGRVTGDSRSVLEMLGHLEPLVSQLMPTESVGLGLIEKGTEQLHLIHVDQSEQSSVPGRGRWIPIRPGLDAEAFDSSSTVVFTPRDSAEVAERAPNFRDLYDAGSRSFMVTPIITRSEVIGTMCFQSNVESAFDKSHENLAERIVRQIAGTLETADLHEQIQHEAQVNELLAEMGRVVNSASSVTKMFDGMKGLSRKLLPIDGMALAIINPGESVAHMIQIDGGSVLPNLPDRQPAIQLDGMLAQVVYNERRTMILCPPIGEHPLDDYPNLEMLYKGGARSFLEVPLVSQDNVLGTLMVFSKEIEAFGPRDASLTERIGSQIAGLIETFSLQERFKSEAQTNQALADVGRLVNSSQSVQGMFAATKQIIRDLIPSAGIGITLVDRENETIRVIDADLGDLSTEEDAILSAPRPLSGSFTNALNASGKPILCTPAADDDLQTHYPGLESIHKSGGRSVVGAPIIAHDRILGALVAYSRKDKAYLEHHSVLLERVANQMAGMVETAQLLEEVRKLANTVEASPDFVALTDPEMRINYINRAGRDLLGIVSDDPIPEGLTGYDLFDSEGRKAVEEVGVPAANQHGFWWGEPRAIRIDGAAFPVEALIVPIDGDASTSSILAYSIQYRDSSRRLQAQAAAEESEERYRDLFDNADELIQSVDSDGAFEYVNQAWLNRLGYRSEELDGMTVWDIIHPDSSEQSRIYFGLLLAGKSAGEVEAIFQTKSGEAVFVRGTANPRIEDGTLISSQEIYRDISARMALEKTKDEFVSVVSHELRTPLTSLRASLGLLAGGVLDDQPEKTSRMLDVAVSNTERLVRLISDILDVERIESGLNMMDIKPWNVLELLEQASGEMSSLADADGVNLKVESPPDLTMPVDRDRMIQTLANLISNAVKYSEEGAEITARARAEESRVVIEIQDHGRGIPSDKLETVFERFQQVDASDSRELGGTGLGLAICKSIIEQHGGRIAVASVEGEGSTFAFWVPLEPVQTANVDSAIDQPVGTA